MALHRGCLKGSNREALDQFREGLANHADEILDMADGLIHQRLLLFVEIDLNDLLHAAGTKDARYADEVAADAIFGITIGGTWKDSLLVLDDGFSHLH